MFGYGCPSLVLGYAQTSQNRNVLFVFAAFEGSVDNGDILALLHFRIQQLFLPFLDLLLSLLHVQFGLLENAHAIVSSQLLHLLACQLLCLRAYYRLKGRFIHHRLFLPRGLLLVGAVHGQVTPDAYHALDLSLIELDLLIEVFHIDLCVFVLTRIVWLLQAQHSSQQLSSVDSQHQVLPSHDVPQLTHYLPLSAFVRRLFDVVHCFDVFLRRRLLQLIWDYRADEPHFHQNDVELQLI